MDCKNLGGTLPCQPISYVPATMYVRAYYIRMYCFFGSSNKKATNCDLFGLGRSLNRDLGRDLGRDLSRGLNHSLEAATNGSLASRLIAVWGLGF